MRASELRLGFITQASAARRGPDLWTNAGLGRLIEALRARVRQITVGVSLAPMVSIAHDHRLAIDADEVMPYAYVPSMARAFVMGRMLTRAVKNVESRADVTIVQLPWAPPHSLAPPRGPRVYHVCADVRGVVRASDYYRGARRMLARGAARIVDAGQHSLMMRPSTRVVTNGEALRRHYGNPPGRAVVSSALTAAEIGSVVRRRPANAPFRVLFVGFLRPEKGLDVLLGAFERLRAFVPDAELRVVGAQDLAEGGAARAAIEAVRAARGTVELIGHRAFGPALFAEYADADVLALPSRSEGTPRVLLEARAFGCPIVASRVGGVPTSVEDGVDGLLVDPGDVGAFADALVQVALEPRLRAALSTGGLKRARLGTVDAYAEAMLEEVLAAYDAPRPTTRRAA